MTKKIDTAVLSVFRALLIRLAQSATLAVRDLLRRKPRFMVLIILFQKISNKTIPYQESHNSKDYGVWLNGR